METKPFGSRQQILPEIYRNQKAAFLQQEVEEHRLEIATLRDRVLQDDRNASAYIELAHVLGRDPSRVTVLREGLARCEPDAELWREAIKTLTLTNRTDEALDVIRSAQGLFPGDDSLRFEEALMLPILYEAPEQLKRYRDRYSSGLQRLIATLELDSPQARRAALDAAARNVNFFLAYQAQNDRGLQEQYGQLVHRIMAANYPEWTRSRDMPPVSGEDKIRVGYVSAHFLDHSVSKDHLGWLVEHDRTRFEVFAYHLGKRVDAVTDEARRASDHFHHIPKDLERTCRTILADGLHVVVFLDLGMYAPTTQLAALRLAPIQCVTWGHPITSGLPTIDYFLSSELMEPEDGQNHYSERLIRLPGIGICYRRPVIPRPLLGKSRNDFGLGEDRIVYLCCQSIFKYLPQHDDLFARIAKRVPASQFAFLALNDMVAGDFQVRLRRAFAAEGLEAADYCAILPEVCTFDYWNLNLVSHVFLDSLEWSGCNTTLEAIACGLPIVTLPGRFMRGRHSYGFLTQLGVTDTIARDKQEYVDIAVRLGEDHEWRAHILQRMKANHSRLYSDTRCVGALENFFRSAVREHLS